MGGEHAGEHPRQHCRGDCADFRAAGLRKRDGNGGAADPGLLAKESIISTLAVLAGQGSIRAALSASLPTPAAALALMTFVLLYPPCAAASASIIKGLKSRKLAVLMVTGQCLLAWICAWIAYRLPLV